MATEENQDVQPRAEGVAEPRVSRWPARFMAVFTLLVVAGIALGGWWLIENPKVAAADGGESRNLPPAIERDASQPSMPIKNAGAASPSGPSEPAGPPTVRDGADYYAHVKLIELRNPPPDADAWDTNGGAPDINYKLFWNDTLLFESSTRDDTLIAEWDLLRLDLRDALLSQQVEIATAMNAPLVNIKGGGVLTVEIWDDDDASPSDLAGRFDLPAELLHEGVNRFDFNAGNVARLEIDLVPARLTLPELIDRYSAR